MAVNFPPRFLQLSPLAVGNAVDLFVSLPMDLPWDSGQFSGSRPVGTLVLRKPTSAGTIGEPDADDLDVVVVAEGIERHFFSTAPAIAVANYQALAGYQTFHLRDYAGGENPALVNGTEYWYKVWLMSTETREGGTAYSDPVSDKTTVGYRLRCSETDWMGLIIERLQAGLRTMIATGQLKTTKDRDGVALMPQVFEGYIVGEKTIFPIVTVNLASQNWDQAAVGNAITGGRHTVSPAGNRVFLNIDGRMNKRTYQITVWSLNRVERRDIGQAIRYLLLANHQVWTGAGATDMSMNSRDDAGLFDQVNRECWLHHVDFTIGAPMFVEQVLDPIIEEIDVTILDASLYANIDP